MLVGVLALLSVVGVDGFAMPGTGSRSLFAPSSAQARAASRWSCPLSVSFPATPTLLQSCRGRRRLQDGCLTRMMAEADAVAEDKRPADEEEQEARTLMGSRRLAEAKDRMLKNARDKQRLLGSRRLRTAREALFRAQSADGETPGTFLGSTRLAKARQAMKARRSGEGQAEIKSRRIGSAGVGANRIGSAGALGVGAMRIGSAPVGANRIGSAGVIGRNRIGSAGVAGVKWAAGLVRVSETKPGQAEVVEEEEELEEDEDEEPAAPMPWTGVDPALNYLGKPATQTQKEQVTTIRGLMATLPEGERAEMSPWIDHLEDVDILRYLLGFPGVDNAWERLQTTARWRKSEKIDTILDEDMSHLFDEGMEEMLYLPPDMRGRPILLYRSSLHKPGKIDPVAFTRYVTRETERATKMYKLGRETESAVIVDRVGSGLKNQDLPLLRELLPVILNHYPYTVGAVYVAPVNAAFNIIWAVLRAFLDPAAQQRFQLMNGDYTATLKEFVTPALLPSSLGGQLDVSAWLAESRAIQAADAMLVELEGQMQDESGEGGGRSLSFAGKEATEKEIVNIGTIRLSIAGLSTEEKKPLGPWILNLDTVDILRFLRSHPVEEAWECIKRTSQWRKEERIDDILTEDLSKLMEEGKEEFFYSGVDNQGRPILVYRSSMHVPGKIDVDLYVRYVVQRVEQGRAKYGLGKDVQCVVLVDRVGSTGSSQDPALLRSLLPCFTTHFPGIIGNIYIAPINTVFYFIWGLASLLLDKDTRESVRLFQSDYTPKLLETIDSSVLPKSLGGDLAVPESSIF